MAAFTERPFRSRIGGSVTGKAPVFVNDRGRLGYRLCLRLRPLTAPPPVSSRRPTAASTARRQNGASPLGCCSRSCLPAPSRSLHSFNGAMEPPLRPASPCGGRDFYGTDREAEPAGPARSSKWLPTAPSPPCTPSAILKIPCADLIQATDGNLYGTVPNGNLFWRRLDLHDHAGRRLHARAPLAGTNADGSRPSAALIRRDRRNLLRHDPGRRRLRERRGVQGDVRW